MSKHGKGRVHGLLQLIRLPNLPTVPGDPLVGFVLSGGAALHAWPQLAGSVGAALLLYAGGLALNDWADADEDGRDRPSRPVPSGAIDRPLALVLAILLLAGGLAFSVGISLRCAGVALLLVAAIVFYDLVAKRIRVAGPMAMGTCRGLSVLLGWGAAPVPGLPVVVLSAALLVALYIFAVSCIACDETRGGPVDGRRWLVPLVLVCAVFVAAGQEGASGAGVLVGAVIVVYALGHAMLLGRALSPEQVSGTVGSLVRGVILLQLLLCVDANGVGATCAVALLGLHVLASAMGRVFYGS